MLKTACNHATRRRDKKETKLALLYSGLVAPYGGIELGQYRLN